MCSRSSRPAREALERRHTSVRPDWKRSKMKRGTPFAAASGRQRRPRRGNDVEEQRRATALEEALP